MNSNPPDGRSRLEFNLQVALDTACRGIKCISQQPLSPTRPRLLRVREKLPMAEIPHGKPRHGKAHVFPVYFCAVNHHEILTWLASNWCKLENHANPPLRILTVIPRAVSRTQLLTRAGATRVQITRRILWHADFAFRPVLSHSNRLAGVTRAQAVPRAMGKNLQHAANTRGANDCGSPQIER